MTTTPCEHTRTRINATLELQAASFADLSTDAHESSEPPGPTTAWLNALRAGVMGANDGIVSLAGLLVGVAGATSSHTALLLAGFAALVAGAFSMACAEYVSVAAQRDAEQRHAADDHDNDSSGPWTAALSSLGSFTAGAVLPLLAMTTTPADVRLPVTAIAALLALALTGLVSARLADTPARPAVIRNLLGGTLAMTATYTTGLLLAAYV